MNQDPKETARLADTRDKDLAQIESLVVSGNFLANDPIHILARECARLRHELDELKKELVPR